MTGMVTMERLYVAPLLSLVGKVNMPSVVSRMLSALLARVILLPTCRPLSVQPMLAVTVSV